MFPVIVIVALFVAQSCFRCGSSTSNGLLSGAGLRNAGSVRLVLVAGRQVTDETMIRDLYAVVEQPERDYISKLARNRQIAFVGRNGRVAYLSYSDAGDLTDSRGSSSFMSLLWQVFSDTASQKPTHIPIDNLSHIRVQLPGKSTALSAESNERWRSIQQPTTRLLQQWSPNNLSGCKRFRQRQIDDLSSKFIEVKMSRPMSFETLIVPRNFEWWPPPKNVETRTRYEEIKCEIVRIISINPGVIRLAFNRMGTSNWVLSSVVGTKEFLGYGTQGQSKLGPDLFQEVVSEIKKQ
jgi:hypothetical protein